MKIVVKNRPARSVNFLCFIFVNRITPAPGAATSSLRFKTIVEEPLCPVEILDTLEHPSGVFTGPEASRIKHTTQCINPRSKPVFLSRVLIAVSLLAAATTSQAAIFGDDNRADVTAQSAMSDWGRSTAIAVLTSNEEVQADGRLRLLTDPIGKLLCQDERFTQQPSLAYACSGFLIAPDILVTAGHCQVNTGEVRNEPEMYCKVFDWLFDYQANDKGETQTADIPMDRLYRCKRTIYAVVDDHAPFRDFAIVQLDRPVTGRRPFKIAKSPVAVGDALAMIGYPMGLPMKSADRARVIFNNPNAMAFVTNLDALAGNSGSAVLNSQNEIAGILIGGTPTMDTVTDKANKCERLNRCDDNGKNCTLPDTDPKKLPPSFQVTGSDVQRIGPVIEILKSMGISGF